MRQESQFATVEKGTARVFKFAEDQEDVVGRQVREEIGLMPKGKRYHVLANGEREEPL